jgi:hypothetical protein
MFATPIAVETLGLVVVLWCAGQALLDWFHYRPPYGRPSPLWIQHRRYLRNQKWHNDIRAFDNSPRRIIQRYRQRRLTLRRGYATP